MTRHTILPALLVCISIQVLSQDEIAPRSFLGVKAGAVSSSVMFTPVVEQDMNLGFTGGLVYKHFAQRNLGIQLELNFLQAGWTEKVEPPASYSRRLSYLQVPFMTHINLGKKKTRLLINLGPYASILLREKEQLDLADELQGPTWYQEGIENRGDFGLSVGLGILRHTSTGTIQLEGRLNQGLSGIYKSGFDNTFLYSRNQAIEVALSYLFGL